MTSKHEYAGELPFIAPRLYNVKLATLTLCYFIQTHDSNGLAIAHYHQTVKNTFS